MTRGDSVPEIRVACTTTLLSAILEAVGREHVGVTTVVPFGMCPGHFDVSPGELEQIRKSDIVLAHGFEQFIRDLAARASGGIGEKIVTVDVRGNWMIPEVQKAAAREAAGILAALRPDKKSAFLDNLDEYEKRIDAAVRDMHDMIAAVSGKVVVCAEMSLEFAEWLGMDAAATFPRDEDVSLKSMHDIVIAGRRNGAGLVVENRQSSGKVGGTIARELGVSVVELSNFPDASAEKSSRFAYIEMLERNIEAIKTALE